MTGKNGNERVKNKIDNFRNREHRERGNSGFRLADTDCGGDNCRPCCNFYSYIQLTATQSTGSDRLGEPESILCGDTGGLYSKWAV